MIPYPRTWVEIDLPALASNLALVHAKIDEPNVKLALVAKADAYGHGLVPISRFAAQNGADWIAIATVQEGIALRDAGIDCPLIVLSPILPVEAEQAVFYRLRTLVERPETALALSAAATAQRTDANVHLKIDSGLGRFGCDPASAAEIAEQIRVMPGIHLEGVATHFSNSGFDPEYTRFQIDQFHAALSRCQQAGITFDVVHAANSAGTLAYPESRHHLVRVGIFAYGIDPYNISQPAPTPVMTWKSRVTALRCVSPGAKIGYSCTFTACRPSTIATVGVGYGDGYPRSLSNCGFAAVRGRECPVVGLVCMDQLLLDTTEASGVEIGDEVTLIGGSITVLRLSQAAQTNVHEITTRIMSRVSRRYLYGETTAGTRPSL